jgi:hypothetical protein
LPLDLRRIKLHAHQLLPQKNALAIWISLATFPRAFDAYSVI